MSTLELIMLALKAAIVTTVFGLGLRTEWRDVTCLLRQPGKLVRSLLAMNIVMPLFAVAIVRLMHLHHSLGVALIALSLCPVPPVLPKKQAKAGGDASYSVGLLAVAALFSIVWIPVAIELVERVFGEPIGVSPMAVAQVVGMTVLLPLLAGAAIHRFTPAVAHRIEPILSRAAGIVLLIVFVLILVTAWRSAFAQIGDGTVIAFAAFVLFGLAVGHLLGGPSPNERTVLALSTASRHPGLALAIAHINFPDEKAVTGIVLLYLMLNALASIPYIAWRKKIGSSSARDANVA